MGANIGIVSALRQVVRVRYGVGMPAYLTTLGQMGLSLAMLSVFALVAGALALWRRGPDRRKPVLMLVLAAVILANVLIVAG